MALIDTLKDSKFFNGLETGYLGKLANLCRGSSYREGEKIVKEGDKATELYLLTNGKVVLEMEVRPVSDRPAIPTAVEVVNKNDIFGWSAVVEPSVYKFSARCMTNCTVLSIKGDMLRKVMADDAGLGFELMKRIAQLISLRLTYTRLRLTNGMGLALHDRELEVSR